MRENEATVSQNKNAEVAWCGGRVGSSSVRECEITFMINISNSMINVGKYLREEIFNTYATLSVAALRACTQNSCLHSAALNHPPPIRMLILVVYHLR